MRESECSRYEPADGDCLTNACGGCCMKSGAELAALRAEVERLEEKVRRIQSACGLPNPAEACRVILAIAAEERK